jgi:spore coat protein U-like protein
MTYLYINKCGLRRVCYGIAVAILCLPSYRIADAAYRIDSCSVSTTGITFGVYDPASATDKTNNSGTVTITCSTTSRPTGTTATITLSKGSGTFAQRLMKNGNYSMNYNVYISLPPGASVWGDGTNSTSTNSWVGAADSGGTFGTVSQTFILYGQIPALQYNVVPGSYTDSLTVTVTY